MPLYGASQQCFGVLICYVHMVLKSYTRGCCLLHVGTGWNPLISEDCVLEGPFPSVHCVSEPCEPDELRKQPRRQKLGSELLLNICETIFFCSLLQYIHWLHWHVIGIVLNKLHVQTF